MYSHESSSVVEPNSNKRSHVSLVLLFCILVGPDSGGLYPDWLWLNQWESFPLRQPIGHHDYCWSSEAVVKSLSDGTSQTVLTYI